MSESIDKAAVHADLLAHLRDELAATTGGEDVREDAAELDQNEPREDDAISQSDQAGDLHGLLDDASDAQRVAIEAADALDVSPADTVRPGAVVEFGGERFVVGLATDPFTSGGREYAGISTDAPIYAAMEGKRAGETFTFRGADHRLDVVA